MSFKWQTDGAISWKDGDAGIVPELPLSEDGGDWTDAYASFNATWSLFGVVNALVSMIGAIPTGRYWLNPTIRRENDEPATPTLGDRYLVIGGADSGTKWLSEGPAGGKIVDCIVVCTAEAPAVAWEYWGDPATWLGAQDQDLVDGASLWNLEDDTYWIYDATGVAWIQCGGSTLEKVVYSGGATLFAVNNTSHRGATFVHVASNSITYTLPACVAGLWYRFLKGTVTGANQVYVQVPAESSDLIKASSKGLVLNFSLPVVPEQVYRKISLAKQNDYVDILGTNEGWLVVGGGGAFLDFSSVSPAVGDAPLQAVGGGASYIDLDASASGDDEEYLGRVIYITAGLCADQIRIITAYDGGTKRATVTPAWTGTTPDSTSYYKMVRYDGYTLGLGDISVVYSNLDQDAYATDTSGTGLFKNDNPADQFPTLSRTMGFNSAETWGALLLGQTNVAKLGAKFATTFGKDSYSRWDNQMVFGCLPIHRPGVAQVSRIVMGANVQAGGAGDLLLGTGDGETAFVTEEFKNYYVTFSVVATISLGTNTPKAISWSGSFLARNDPHNADLEIVIGSKNITETGNDGSPDLVLDIEITGNNLQFRAYNNEAGVVAHFVGFADVIETELQHDVF